MRYNNHTVLFVWGHPLRVFGYICVSLWHNNNNSNVRLRMYSSTGSNWLPLGSWQAANQKPKATEPMRPKLLRELDYILPYIASSIMLCTMYIYLFVCCVSCFCRLYTEIVPNTSYIHKLYIRCKYTIRKLHHPLPFRRNTKTPSTIRPLRVKPERLTEHHTLCLLPSIAISIASASANPISH